MKIAGVTLCFNESNMIKYVMPYWDRIKPDKLIVYDNMSTDNTVELLKQYPYVEVRTFDTGGKFCDKTNSRIKTETCAELKEAGYDYGVAIATQAEINAGAACGQLSLVLETE